VDRGAVIGSLPDSRSAKEVNRVNIELLERPVEPASAIVKGT
jgi:hypothetical protein